MDITCGIFLINKNNQLLLVHPTNAPKFKWSIPKGLVEKDEEFLDTGLRELFEETNVKLEKDSPKIKRIMEFHMMKYPKKSKQLKSFAILVDDDFSDVTLKCTSTFENRDGVMIPENDSVKWFPLNFSNVQIHETQEEILKILLNILKG